jgi:hypothetical protein
MHTNATRLATFTDRILEDIAAGRYNRTMLPLFLAAHCAFAFSGWCLWLERRLSAEQFKPAITKVGYVIIAVI